MEEVTHQAEHANESRPPNPIIVVHRPSGEEDDDGLRTQPDGAEEEEKRPAQTPRGQAEQCPPSAEKPSKEFCV